MIMLRPIIEYCAPVYHPMLTKDMTNRLEGLQRRALRIIYGFDKSHEELLVLTGLETLEERRVHACYSFASKMASSPKFQEWFPRTDTDAAGPNLRTKKLFVEEFARTDRLYHSPLFYMRRILNQDATQEITNPLENIRDIYEHI